MANKVRHTHKYYYDEKNKIWVCSGYEGCSHFRPKNMPDPLGVKSICWKCAGEFYFNERNLSEINPRCEKCSKTMDLDDLMPYFDEWQEYRARTQDFCSYEKFEVIRAGGIKPILQIVPKIEEPDEIEVIESHAADCSIYTNGNCDCGAS